MPLLAPACAKACPTESILFGEIDDLRDPLRIDGGPILALDRQRHARAGPRVPDLADDAGADLSDARVRGPHGQDRAVAGAGEIEHRAGGRVHLDALAYQVGQDRKRDRQVPGLGQTAELPQGIGSRPGTRRERIPRPRRPGEPVGS